MSGRRDRTCYVAMPFGRKPSADGGTVDFDDLYHRAVAHAILAAGLEPVRADRLPVAVSIANAILELVLSADLMIADATIRHGPALERLGKRPVRHAEPAGHHVRRRRSGRIGATAADALIGMLMPALAAAPGVDTNAHRAPRPKQPIAVRRLGWALRSTV